MTKVVRELIVEGGAYVIECAVCADGTSPALAFLTALGDGMWEPDPETTGLPDDAQIGDHAFILQVCKKMADDGLPLRGSAVNALNDGIWEIRRSTKRLTFYDTDGSGSYTPKPKIRYRADSPDPEDEEFWWFPDFDDYIRLGHAFGKTSQKTLPKDLDRAETVRREDLQHDEQ